MRCLERNKTDFEYLPYDGTETDLNEYGEHTGELHRTYGDPVAYRGNISTPSGQVNQSFYGDDVRYTHTLVMDNPNVEMDESGLIRWKGDLYEIRARRPSLNVVSFALRKQTVEHDDPYVDPETEPEGGSAEEPEEEPEEETEGENEGGPEGEG